MTDEKEFNIPRVAKTTDRQLQKMLATRLASKAFDKFYKDGTARTNIFLSAALGLSLLMNFYQLSKPIQHDYVYADRSGRIMTLYAMNKPNLSDADVTTWVSQAVTDTLSFNYQNYRTILQNASGKYFTQTGWDSFQKEMTTSHLLQFVTDNNLILTTKVTAAPTLEAYGVMDGVYAWSFKIPVELSRKGTRSARDGTLREYSESQNMVINVIVTRQPEIISENGIGIAKIFMSEE